MTSPGFLLTRELTEKFQEIAHTQQEIRSAQAETLQNAEALVVERLKKSKPPRLKCSN